MFNFILYFFINILLISLQLFLTFFLVVSLLTSEYFITAAVVGFLIFEVYFITTFTYHRFSNFLDSINPFKNIKMIEELFNFILYFFINILLISLQLSILTFLIIGFMTSEYFIIGGVFVVFVFELYFVTTFTYYRFSNFLESINPFKNIK